MEDLIYLKGILLQVQAGTIDVDEAVEEIQSLCENVFGDKLS